jgi:hypothetical protein
MVGDGPAGRRTARALGNGACCNRFAATDLLRRIEKPQFGQFAGPMRLNQNAVRPADSGSRGENALNQ